eukprot:scaffold1485_cov171-Amphora_coffeaeformis.AAC.22
MSSTTGPLSAIQLRDVQDALRKPLTSRRVLIPVGSKAFVAGELCPSLDESSQQEMIQLRTADESGDLMTIARQDAIARIQQDIQALRPAKPAVSKQKPAPPTKSSLKSQQQTPPKNSNPSKTAAAPNYFEIREEINEEGKEVHAEAVDITNHLKVWEEQVGTAMGPAGSSSNDATDLEELETIVEPEPVTKVTDEDFAALSARLDQLARLEEAEEARQTSSRKSAKKLQSKGWAKGFLNKNSPSRPTVSPRAEVPMTVSDTTRRVSAPTVSKSETAKPAANVPTKPRETGQPESKAENSGRVAFTESTEVREIPRIGQRSVREIQKTASTNTTMPMQGSAISEVVRERPRKNRQQERNNNSDSGENLPQQRKLSRFAQQRMELS